MVSRTDRPRILWNIFSDESKSAGRPNPAQKSTKATAGYIEPISISVSKPRLFALIIGINYYDNVKDLRGSVSDALAVKEYLEAYLKVPADQITTLLNKSASRSAIISSLQGIRDDSRITNGDPILIYYAGHGSEILAPESWAEGSKPEDSKIQVIIPQDYCAGTDRKVDPIPDRAFSALLEQIAGKKGDNITVIFDCCHSASGTRSGGTSMTRSVNLDGSVISDSLDREIWEIPGARGQHVVPKFQHSGLRSHVLIAACAESESATEDNGHGNFTVAFLKLLRTVGPDKLRYSDVLSQMDPIPRQNPQCEGVNRNRHLFNSKITSPTLFAFSVRSDQGVLTLEAGAAHGITPKAEFAVYPNKESILKADFKPLGPLVVDAVDIFRSTLVFPSNERPYTLAQDAVAVQTSAGERTDLRIYIPDDERFHPFHSALTALLQDSHYDFRNVDLVSTPEDAHLEVAKDSDSNQFILCVKDDRISRYGFNRLFHSLDPGSGDLVQFLKAAAHYYWELNRTSNNSSATSGVQIDVFRLKESQFDFDDFGHPEMTPEGPNLYDGTVFDFVVENDVPYGIKLTNNTPHDLFPNLFYFDNSDLSIGSYYQSNANSGPYATDVPLKKDGGILTIGYGSGGVPPFSYFLREGQDLDVGFLKLFLSSRPIDLSGIPQRSPFDGASRSGTDPTKEDIETWGSILIPVIQRREPAPEVNPILQVQKDNEILKRENAALHEMVSQLTAERDVARKKVADLAATVEGLQKPHGPNKDESDTLIASLAPMRAALPSQDAPHPENQKRRKSTLKERARHFLGLRF